LILTIILAGVSATAMASPKEGREGKLSFVPKISFGKDTGSDSMTDGDIAFHGLEADLLYGVTRNFEMGVNVGWSPYEAFDSIDAINSKEDYDEVLDTFKLMAVMRYSINQLDVLTPYISVKGGWVFGDAEYNARGIVPGPATAITGKVEGQWAVGVAIGLEYKNVDLEIGYEITEFKETFDTSINSISIDKYKGFSQEKLVYLSIGYRFE